MGQVFQDHSVFLWVCFFTGPTWRRSLQLLNVLYGPLRWIKLGQLMFFGKPLVCYLVIFIWFKKEDDYFVADPILFIKTICFFVLLEGFFIGPNFLFFNLHICNFVLTFPLFCLWWHPQSQWKMILQDLEQYCKVTWRLIFLIVGVEFRFPFLEPGYFDFILNIISVQTKFKEDR